MKKIALATLLGFSFLVAADDVDTPLKAQYRELQANNCYCNNPAGVSLVNASQLKPSEKKMNEEISQMILDAKNEQYLIRAFWIKGLGAEANEFAPQRAFYSNFNYAEKEFGHELEKKNRKKCIALDAEINAINTQILLAEMKLAELKKSN